MPSLVSFTESMNWESGTFECLAMVALPSCLHLVLTQLSQFSQAFRPWNSQQLILEALSFWTAKNDPSHFISRSCVNTMKIFQHKLAGDKRAYKALCGWHMQVKGAHILHRPNIYQVDKCFQAHRQSDKRAMTVITVKACQWAHFKKCYSWCLSSNQLSQDSVEICLRGIFFSMETALLLSTRSSWKYLYSLGNAQKGSFSL